MNRTVKGIIVGVALVVGAIGGVVSFLPDANPFKSCEPRSSNEFRIDETGSIQTGTSYGPGESCPVSSPGLAILVSVFGAAIVGGVLLAIANALLNVGEPKQSS